MLMGHLNDNFTTHVPGLININLEKVISEYADEGRCKQSLSLSLVHGNRFSNNNPMDKVDTLMIIISAMH